jgi:uncharacterized membrane protein
MVRIAKGRVIVNGVLWVLQILLAVYFFFTGIVHLVLPADLPAPMAWMYDLSPALHWVSGVAEMLAGLGLILPGLTKIQPRLTPLAAAGLVLIMIGAAAWHVQRGELPNLLMNALLGVLAAFVAFGRWRWRPLPERASA